MTRPDSQAERVSRQMSNALYNLSHVKVFSNSHREQCRDLVKAWDEATYLRSRFPSEEEVARALFAHFEQTWGYTIEERASLAARAVLALFTPAGEEVMPPGSNDIAAPDICPRPAVREAGGEGAALRTTAEERAHMRYVARREDTDALLDDIDTLLAQVERQAHNIMGLIGAVETAAKARLAAEARAREMEEALKPFARYARAVEPGDWASDDGEMCEVFKAGLRVSLRTGDLRRAAALVTEAGE